MHRISAGFLLALTLAAGAAPAHAQSAGAPDLNSSKAQAAAQPQAAVAAMQESLSKQRASVQQQPAQRAVQGFFVLPPPAALGTPRPGGLEPPGPAAMVVSTDCAPLSPPAVDALVGEAARKEAVDGQLLQLVMKQESAFRPCAVSSKGAMGLMQLMPATAEELEVKNPFDPLENVDAGAKLLRQLLDRYNGDVRLALGAYNAGPAAVDAVKDVPPFRETIDYVRTILSSIPWKP
jgi:soluble lytic murein transglycosylase-like protein